MEALNGSVHMEIGMRTVRAIQAGVLGFTGMLMCVFAVVDHIDGDSGSAVISMSVAVGLFILASIYSWIGEQE